MTGDHGEPLPGITVHFGSRIHEIADLSFPFLTTVTGHDGRFRFSGIPPGCWDVWTVDPSRQWTKGQGVELGSTDLEFRLSPAGVLEVRLISAEGEDLEPVDCRGDLVLTHLGPDGHRFSGEFEISPLRQEHLRPGQYSVQVRVPGVGSGEVRPVEIRAGENTTLQLPLDSPGCSPSGRVLAPEDGSTLVDAKVSATNNAALHEGGEPFETAKKSTWRVRIDLPGFKRLTCQWRPELPMEPQVLQPDSETGAVLRNSE